LLALHSPKAQIADVRRLAETLSNDLSSDDTLELAYGLPKWTLKFDLERLRDAGEDEAALHLEYAMELLSERPEGVEQRVRDVLFHPRGVATAGTVVAGPSRRDALNAIVSGAAFERECGWRAVRVDVPVLLDSHAQPAIVGLHVEPISQRECPPDCGGVDLIDAERCDDQFRAGVVDGREAARRLLNGMGVDAALVAELDYLRVRVLGRHNDLWRLEGGSVGLPMALALLADTAERAGRRWGPMVACATGVIADPVGGTLQRMLPEDATAKLAAVRDDRIRDELITPLLIRRGRHDGDLPPLGLHPVATLRDAARHAWGERWDAWREVLISRRLAQAGSRRARFLSGAGAAGASPRRIGEVPIHVETELQRTLWGSIVGGASVELVCGPPQSGKTYVAARIAEVLEDRDWRVWWITAPDLAELDELAATVAELAHIAAGRHALLILDDLDAEQDASDLDAALRRLSSTDLPLLVLARTQRGAGDEWTFSEFTPRRAISGPADVATFAEELLEGVPALVPARPWTTRAIRAAGGDLGVLIELLVHAACHSGLDETVAPLEQLALTRLGAFPDRDARHAVRTLAAVSMLRAGAEVDEALDARELTALGARRLDDGTWRIESARLAETLLAHSDPLGLGALEGLVLDRVRAALAAGGARENEVVELMRGARRCREDLPGRLVAALTPSFDAWVNASSVSTSSVSPRAIALALDTLNWRDDHTAAWAQALARKLAAPAELLDVSTLATCLRVVRSYRREIDEVDGLWRHMAGRISEELPTILKDTTSTISGRVRLMTRVAITLATGRQLLRENFAATIGSVDRRNPVDYRCALEAIDALGHFAGFEVADGIEFRGADAAHVLGQITETLDPLREPPEPTESNAGVWLGWIGLEARLQPDRKWNELMQDVSARSPLVSHQGTAVSVLEHAVTRTPPAELAVAIRHLDEHVRGFPHRLLHYVDISGSIASTLRHAGTLGEIAGLVATLRATHAPTTYRLLTPDGEPRSELLDRCRRLAWDRRDPKGVSILLKAAAAIDEQFIGGEGFALTLADRLERGPSERTSHFVERVIREDERSSIVLHLIEALAEASWPGLGNVLDAGADHVARAIEVSGNPGPGRLALMLAADPAVGPDFLRRLADRLQIPDDRVAVRHHRLAARMLSGADPSALATFHLLGRALDPPRRPLVTRFRADVLSGQDNGAIGRLVASRRAEHVAEAARAFARTLASAGATAPTETVLELLDQNGWRWEDRVLSATADAGWAVPTISILRELSPPVAHEAVGEILATNRHRLRDAVWAALVKEAAGGLSLLSALERAHAGAGRRLLAELCTTRAWRQVRIDLRYMAAARQQAQAYRTAARLGWIPPADERDWLWDGRWRRQIDDLRGIRGLDEMLRWFAGWPDPEPADEFLRVARWDLIAGRIDAEWDLAALPALLATLCAVRREDVARSIAAELTEPRLRDLSTASLARLLDVLGELDLPALREAALRAALTRIEQATAQPFAVDRDRHWHEIGQLAHLVHRYGAPAAVCRTIPPTFDINEPVDVIGALAWFEPSDGWASERLGQAVADLRAGQVVVHPDALPETLIAVSHLGEADALPIRSLADKAWGASFRACAELVSATWVDPVLANEIDVTSEPAQHAGRRASAQWARGDFHAVLLARRLGA
jgi:hypothetical protein